VEKNIDLPYTVIGGIKEHNLDEVLSRGAKSVCLISELICNENTLDITKSYESLLNFTSVMRVLLDNKKKWAIAKR
ncbi:MAG: hypothetical protein ACRCYT_03820, partial [Cetobacterium sp.]